MKADVILRVLLLLWCLADPLLAASLAINLVPCGPVPEAVLAHLEEGLAQEFGAPIARQAGTAIPQAAYVSERRQYRGEAFLTPVPAVAPDIRSLTLVVTAVDLFVPRLNFIFGLADPHLKTAVIALARLDPRFYGQAEDPGLLNERALKEAVHELGHLLGLGHCPNPACIMFFSNTLADTDRKGPGFCPVCRRQVRK